MMIDGGDNCGYDNGECILHDDVDEEEEKEENYDDT